MHQVRRPDCTGSVFLDGCGSGVHRLSIAAWAANLSGHPALLDRMWRGPSRLMTGVGRDKINSPTAILHTIARVKIGGCDDVHLTGKPVQCKL